jgi:hypothetical protein
MGPKRKAASAADIGIREGANGGARKEMKHKASDTSGMIRFGNAPLPSATHLLFSFALCVGLLSM